MSVPDGSSATTSPRPSAPASPAAGPGTGPAAPSAWAPLRNVVFRSLWLAVLFSNIGTWMQTVGAQWLLVEEPNAATLVSLVQTASMLPVLLLALPSGTLADTFDRRRLLLSVQLGLVVVGSALTVLTALDRMPPPVLLSFTFALGVGQALTLPTWQAIIPELVPRPQIPSASALGSVSVNLARSVGPAVAGVLVAQVGVAAVFGFNTLTFAIFAVAVLRWHRTPDSPARRPEPFGAALRAGGRYVRFSPVVRRILLRVALFVVPGSAVWGLLPLVASRQLAMGSSGYGILLGALGVGAIIGVFLLPLVRARLSPNRLQLVAGLLYAAAMVVVAVVTEPVTVILALVPAGLAWMTVVSSVNASMQLFLPGWVRARGISTYQVVFAGGQALGALVWGAVADVTSLRTAYLSAAVLMAAGALTVLRWPMFDVAGIDRSPVNYWPEPHLMLEPEPGEGPVLITSRYRVTDANRAAFVTTMQAVSRSRRRTGASQWGLFRDGTDPDVFVEVYLVPTWEEHLRQHEGRLTGSDRANEEAALALAQGPPEVSHLLPPNSPDLARN